MGDDEDLRINTLHRFAKHSPSLILEEYSHCEIPAGCGGVVLRWYDPADGHPVTVRVRAEGATSEAAWLDGTALASSRAMLRPGAHALAVHLRRSAPSGRATFALHLAFDADEDRDIIAAGAPRYRLTTVAPAADWFAAPAADWAAPDAGSLDDIDAKRRYWFDDGATLHAFDAPDAWLLVTFTSGAP